jgi:hypothetical protein
MRWAGFFLRDDISALISLQSGFHCPKVLLAFLATDEFSPLPIYTPTHFVAK